MFSKLPLIDNLYNASASTCNFQNKYEYLKAISTSNWTEKAKSKFHKTPAAETN